MQSTAPLLYWKFQIVLIKANTIDRCYNACNEGNIYMDLQVVAHFVLEKSAPLVCLCSYVDYDLCSCAYRIRPNFRGAQFSRIGISKQFAETIFVDQEFRVYGILKFRELNFRGLLESAKTAKTTLLENLDVYGTCTHNETVLYVLDHALQLLATSLLSVLLSTGKVASLVVEESLCLKYAVLY